MNNILASSLRLGLTLAGGALLTALPVDLSVSGKAATVSVAWNNACAATTLAVDGSCKPYPAWVCGLNGQNYWNMKFVPPGC